MAALGKLEEAGISLSPVSARVMTFAAISVRLPTGFLRTLKTT
jgi:hypothetical protein